LLEVIDSAKRE
jgi:phosphatidylserine/phosphatidylglycerophosphate/cardiolipin synthase-like enzyme